MGAYTTIDDPSAFFQTALYTGNATNGKTVTNDGNSDLQPDWVWVKSRSATANHNCSDSSRGATKHLAQNITYQEEIVSGITGYNSDGFTLGTNGDSNGNGTTFVAWQWKCNAGTTATNTTGSVDSVVQVNSDAGFSIVTFDSASSGNFSVGHGLGVQPAMIITKNRESASNWWTWHKGLTGGNSNTSYVVALERTTAEASYANAWGAGVTSSVFGMQSGNTATASNDYVAYCFAEKQGFSKFGNYVGTGNANGPMIATGFKPAFVMLKPTTFTEEWAMIDTKRNPFNQAMKQLKANSDGAEYDGASVTNGIDILSNGFKVRTSRTEINATTHTYIYMAFAENPFVTSTSIPTTAR